MARPPQDAIDTFMSIAGASEAVALQKLEEHGGDLNEAVNAYFSERDRINSHPMSVPPHNDFMSIDDPIDVDSEGPPFPLLSAARNLNPFALLDQNFGPSLFDRRGIADIASGAPRVLHPREVREIPIEFKDGSNQPGSSSQGPTVEDVTGSESAVGPAILGHVTMDEENEDFSFINSAQAAVQNERKDDHLHQRDPEPSAPHVANMTDYNNDIEEEMIKAAIEASKRDAVIHPNQQFGVPDVPSGLRSDKKSPVFEDVELAHAVSLSLKTAEEEKALRGQGVQIEQKGPSSSSAVIADEQARLPAENGRQEFGPANSGTSSRLVLEEGNPALEEDAEDVEEQPLVRNRSRRIASGATESSKEVVQVEDSSPSSPGVHGVGHPPQKNGHPFHSDEWGGISSEEHDEAVMLEAAMFGGIPDRAAYNFSYPTHQAMQTGTDRHPDFYPWMRSPSPGLVEQRLLREQQDDAYLASLQADREKELKAMQEAELRRLEEAAAREAALEEEKHQQEETRRKFLEEEEYERELAAKQASLPEEPALDDESAVTLLVRLPDGSRRGRRFLKNDKLQFLFDFIDVGRVVKPHSYRLVRPYPRRAFSDAENNLSLSELGLTNKQEALFLELI